MCKDNCKIVDFIPLPVGWFNYYDEDGKTFRQPCPGVFKVEHTWEEDNQTEFTFQYAGIELEVWSIEKSNDITTTTEFWEEVEKNPFKVNQTTKKPTPLVDMITAIKNARKAENDLVVETNDLIREILNKKAGDRVGNHWGTFAPIAFMEDAFAERFTWTEIREKAGATFSYKLSEAGSETEGSTITMVIGENTGLEDLQVLEVPLTKWRVALKLLWNDDYKAMVKDVIEMARTDGGIK